MRAGDAGGGAQPFRASENLLAKRQSAEARLFELRGQRAAILAERVALESLHRSRVEAAERAQRRIASRRGALATLAAERSQIETERVRATEELSEKDAALTAAIDGLNPVRSTIAELAERQQAAAHAVEAGRSTFAASERALLDAELRLARAQEDADRLRADLETEGLTFDLDAAQPNSVDEPAGTSTQAATADLEAAVRSLRRRIRELGAVNEEATTDYRESKERFEFLSTQMSDLRDAETALLEALEQLRQLVRDQFRATFQMVNADFQVYFRMFFG